MQRSLAGVVDDLRQPAYTGANRCVPCTVVNVFIAFALGAGVSFVLTPLGGGVVLAGSLALIYLRGYLVPGTPTLTKRYLPDRVLAWFDKGPEPGRPGSATDGDAVDRNRGTERDPSATDGDAVDPEAVLSAADAVEPCEDEEDLCLTDSFAAAWHDEIDRLRDEDARLGVLADLFGTDTDAVSVDTDYGHVSVSDGGTRVGAWPSEGAMIADLAADRALASRTADWTDIAPAQRFGVLAGLRSFLETCPLCDGTVDLGEHTVESCCRSWEVIAVRCTDCDTELLELDPETLATVA